MKQTTRRRNTGVLAALLLGFFALFGVGLPAAGVGTGSISGTVTVPDGDTVYLQIRSLDNTWVDGMTLPTDGSFAFSDLADGDYILSTNGSEASMPTFYPGTTDASAAEPVSVTGGASVTGIDFAVVLAAGISGTVSASSSEPFAVQVYDSTGILLHDQFVSMEGGTGAYEVFGLAAGTYTVAFQRTSTSTNLAAAIYRGLDDTAGLAAATPISLAEGEKAQGVDAELVIGGTATGVVVEEAGLPVPNARVLAIPADGTPATRYTWTDDDGKFTIPGLSTRDYIVQVVERELGYLFYGNVRKIDQTTPVAMTIGENVDLGVLSYATGPTVDRWDGLDRYEVSANISVTNFPDGAGTVYVANGLASADALAAGPVAGMNEGPILLVKKDGIPTSVGRELNRLNPDTVVVLGGEGSVSATVEDKLATYAADVIRWDGADRYVVSANISKVNFPAGADTVYVANGLASADALAAGPVAGMEGGPILLVKKDGIPTSVATELKRLQPKTVVVLGGEGSVSGTVEDKLATYADDVMRWDGADRYVVSANISSVNFPGGAGTVFVANGLASADALAAGPVAAMIEGPILLVKKDGIPTNVAEEIERITPARIVILGGTGSVSEIVEDRLETIW